MEYAAVRSWGIPVTATVHPDQSDYQKPMLEDGDKLKFAQGGKLSVLILSQLNEMVIMSILE